MELLEKYQQYDPNISFMPLQTRIDLPYEHFTMSLGDGKRITVSCPNSTESIDINNMNFQRKMLSVSFDILCDWQLVSIQNQLLLFNNRISRNKIIETEVSPDRFEAFAKSACTKTEFIFPKDYGDISDRILYKVEFLKKLLIGDPQNPRVHPVTIVNDVLNACIFLRFIEDIEWIKNGERIIDLTNITKDLDRPSLVLLVKKVFDILRMQLKTDIFNVENLVNLDSNLDLEVIEWLLSFYNDDCQGKYEYDFGLISEYSIGEIYEKYVSTVSLNNGQSEIFPEFSSLLELKKGTGLVYTPDDLAKFLVEESLENFRGQDTTKLTMGDFSCGSGIFIRNYIKHQFNTNKIKPSEIINNIYGIDINDSAIAATRLNIAMTTFTYEGTIKESTNTLIADSLQPDVRSSIPISEFDVILMNPPFKGYDSLSRDNQCLVRQFLGDMSRGKVDYSLAFVYKAFTSLKENGVMGLILPASFLSSSYASKVRNLLSCNGDIQFIIKFEDYNQFSHGDTQFILLMFKKCRYKTRLTRVLISRTSIKKTLGLIREQSWGSYPDFEQFKVDSTNWKSEWTITPFEITQIMNKLKRLHSRLDGVFDIYQGVRIGAKKVFIIKDVDEFPVNEHSILKHVADDDNIFDWRIIEDSRRLIYPYADNRVLFDQSRMENEFPEVTEYLENNRPSLQKRKKIQGDGYWGLADPKEPKVLFQKKLVSPHFGFAEAYAFDYKGIYAVTNGSFLIPKVPFSSIDHWYYYLGILNSEVFFKFVARFSQRVKGGQFDYDSRFVEKLPIPNSVNVDTSIRLYIADYAKKKTSSGFPQLDHEKFNEMVLAAYNLSAEEVSKL
ncbi:MAG: N-6 DNA methylase [Candidatus Hatepunaea meridiana]|nr:N-6 DNA methylase [Candidatus Hatepunaea meridiana]